MTVAIYTASPDQTWTFPPETTAPPETPDKPKAPPPGSRSASNDPLGAPPAPRRKVTQQEADQSLQRVLDRANLPLDAKRFSLQSVATIMAIITKSASANKLKLAEISAQGQQQITDALKVLRSKQCDELDAKIDKAQQDQQKAQKSGILGVVFDWIASVAKIVIGVVKIITGNILGGVADLVGAAASIVKSAAETALLVNPNDKTAQKIYDDSKMVEMAFDIIGFIGGGGALNAAKRVVVGVTTGASGISKEVINVQRSGLQEDISKLSAHIDLLNAWIEGYKADTATRNDDARDNIQKSADIQKQGSQAIKDLYDSPRWFMA